MKNHTTLKIMSVTAAVFAMTLHSSTVLANDPPEIKQTGAISYVTGGIGDEERDAMRAVQHDYNLHVLSAGASGAYPGDTHIVISDNRGHELLSTDADPLFYAQLKSGHYVVEESSAGQSKKQAIVIADNKPVSTTFRWR